LRRYSAAVHGAGVELYDLFSTGFFGRPDQPAATAAVWASLSTALRGVGAMAAAAAAAPGRHLAPDVVVFVDDEGMAALALSGASKANDLALPGLPVAIGLAGAAVEYNLLSDLLRPRCAAALLGKEEGGRRSGSLRGHARVVVVWGCVCFGMAEQRARLERSFSLDGCRLAVFSNAIVLTPALEAAVAARVAGGNRTLLCRGAARDARGPGLGQPRTRAGRHGVPARRRWRGQDAGGAAGQRGGSRGRDAGPARLGAVGEWASLW